MPVHPLLSSLQKNWMEYTILPMHFPTIATACVLAALFAVAPGTLAAPVAQQHSPPALIDYDTSGKPHSGLLNLGDAGAEHRVDIINPNIIIPHSDHHDQSDGQQHKSGSNVAPVASPSTPYDLPSASSMVPSRATSISSSTTLGTTATTHFTNKFDDLVQSYAFSTNSWPDNFGPFRDKLSSSHVGHIEIVFYPHNSFSDDAETNCPNDLISALYEYSDDFHHVHDYEGYTQYRNYLTAAYYQYSDDDLHHVYNCEGFTHYLCRLTAHLPVPRGTTQA